MYSRNSVKQIEFHFTPEIAAKLASSAAQKGRNPDELVQDILAQYLDEESRFFEAVKRGEDALQRGDAAIRVARTIYERCASLSEFPNRGRLSIRI